MQYDNIRTSIEAAGFFTTYDRGRQILHCASERISEIALTGNSFWVSKINDSWFVGTWGGLIYSASDTHIVELCITLLATEWTLSAIPEEVIRKFDVIRISDEEYERRLSNRNSSKRSRPP